MHFLPILRWPCAADTGGSNIQSLQMEIVAHFLAYSWLPFKQAREEQCSCTHLLMVGIWICCWTSSRNTRNWSLNGSFTHTHTQTSSSNPNFKKTGGGERGHGWSSCNLPSRWLVSFISSWQVNTIASYVFKQNERICPHFMKMQYREGPQVFFQGGGRIDYCTVLPLVTGVHVFYCCWCASWSK